METAPQLVWIDLEMTGLDPATCAIVEIACLVTDSELEVVAEGPDLVVRPPDDVLARMSANVRELHERSGLYARILASSTPLEEAEARTLEFISRHVPPQGGVLCGNSIWKDRSFLERHMPEVHAYLHYKMIDVSSIKEVVRRWYPPELHAPKKKELHRAKDDILESIDELRWYRDRIFRERSPARSGTPSDPSTP